MSGFCDFTVVQISEWKSTQNITPCTLFEDTAVGLFAGPFKTNLPLANYTTMQKCD